MVQRSEAEAEMISKRKKWKRFGLAKGTTGTERGVTMPSGDLVEILDPYSDEAKKTGEEKLIERIQQKIQGNKNNSKSSKTTNLKSSSTDSS